jgi:histidyl-tRNA synthetase
MRMIAEEMRNDTKPLRLSYYGQCYRYEEFKKGRYREFFQYGVELIGASGPLAEAEVIALAIDMLDACGLKNWEIRVGHVGILKGALTGLGLAADAPEGASEPPIASAMRLLDKGDDAGLEALFSAQGIDPSHAAPLRALANLEGGIETLGPARDILSSLSGVSLEALDDLQTTLEAVAHLAPAPPSLAVDLTVARGLDYYTGMVFEVKVPEMGGEGQVLGGGSYKLLHLFGLPDLDPCCGFGLGFDRVLLGLEAQAEAAGREEVVPGEVDPLGTIAVIPFGIDASHVLPIVAALRNAGERVDLELRSRKIGKAMKWANSTGAAFTVVVGPRDLESGQAMLKSLKSGEQQAVELNAEALQAALAAMRS